MKAHVFKLYRNGHRLSTPEGPYLGNLLVKAYHDADGMTAHVEGVDESDLAPMFKASIKCISKVGVVVRGIEALPRSIGIKTKVDHVRQVWWGVTEGSAVAAIKLKQLEVLMQRDERLLKQINALCSMEGWTPAHRSEVARLEQLAVERVLLMQQLQRDAQQEAPPA